MTVNPYVWFAEREVDHVPPHFIKCPSPIRADSLEWIKDKSTGRYAIADCLPTVDQMLVFRQEVFFENHADAVMYELLWSGT